MDRRLWTFGQPRSTRRALLAGAAGLAVTRLMTHDVVAQDAASPVASPDVAVVDARERLRGVLSLLPSSVLESAMERGQFFDWIDYQQHFAAHGVDDPYDESVEIGRYMIPVGSGDPLFLHAMNPEAQELLGFRVFDVHQVLSAGIPPEMYTVYRGGVDFEALTDLWESSGYSLVSGDHGEFWSRSEDASVDLQDPLQKVVLARMNNMAILDGTTLVTTPTAPMIERVLEIHATDAESAAASPNIVPLIDAMPPDTVNAMAFPGETFSRPSAMPQTMTPASLAQLEQLFDESDDAVGPMPPLQSALCGVTAGVLSPSLEEEGIPDMGDVTAFLSFLTGSEDDARQAAEVAFWRIDNMDSFNTGEPYAEFLDVTNSVDEAADGPVMTLELGPEGAARSAWYRVVYSMDILPFAW